MIYLDFNFILALKHWKMDMVSGLKKLVTMTDGSISEQFVTRIYKAVGKFDGNLALSFHSS